MTLNYANWTADLCPMQCRGQLNFGMTTPISSISKHFLAPYFTHVQIFHIIDNWHATSTNSLKSCLYVITLHRQHVWLHCSVRVITRGAMITDQVRPHRLASNRRHHATVEHSDRKGSARKMKTMRAQEDQNQFQYMGAYCRKWTDLWGKDMSQKIPR